MSKIDHDLLIDHRELAICEQLGSGTFGDVYKAKWGKLVVAVKKLNTNGAKAEEVQKLIEEVHTLLKVRHPLVLGYYGACVVGGEVGGGEIWIVMEYGRSLHLELQDKQASAAIRGNWSIEVLRAVEYLHKRNIIHKGIKSTNFLIVNGDLKISDFGMETAVKIKNHNLSARTEPRSHVGTARWKAPECTNAPYAFTMQSDVFAIGMLLWEITLSFPDRANDDDVVNTIKLNKRPIFPPECKPSQKSWIEKCWDHEPSNRPTVSEVHRALIAALLPPEQNPVHYEARKTNRKYFHVNIAELKNMKPDNIRTLTVPPKCPPGGGPPPYLPLRVDIYTLTPLPNTNHDLESEKYEARLFNRVNAYFKRFYVPTDSSLVAIIESVQVIYNPVLEQQFEHENYVFNSQFKGLSELKKEDDTELTNLQKEYLLSLITSKNLKDENSNPISAWHGVDPANLDSICWYGLLNLSANDSGYYGKGIYFTQRPSYGELYANTLSPAMGKASLLLCWVLLGRPWAQTKVHSGSECKPGHTSHYVLVANKGLSPALCKTEDDYNSLAGSTNYYPVEEKDVLSAQGDEIVVFRSEQVLPRFIVNYRVVKKDAAAPSVGPPSSRKPVTTSKTTTTTSAKPPTLDSAKRKGL